MHVELSVGLVLSLNNSTLISAQFRASTSLHGAQQTPEPTLNHHHDALHRSLRETDMQDSCINALRCFRVVKTAFTEIAPCA